MRAPEVNIEEKSNRWVVFFTCPDALDLRYGPFSYDAISFSTPQAAETFVKNMKLKYEELLKG